LDSPATYGDAWDGALRAIIKLIVCLTLALAAADLRVMADGGTAILQKQAGPFVITLFADPTPVRVGRVDLSILCQNSGDKSTVMDAKVFLHLRKPGGSEIIEFTLPATHALANNKMLYAANLNLPTAGKWRVKVDVTHGKDEASITGDLQVLESEPALVTYWPFFVLVPLIALLFAINRRLRRGREVSHPRARR
jgi:hypothetical protein